MKEKNLSRRSFIRNVSAAVAGSMAVQGCASQVKSCAEEQPSETECLVKRGRINQSTAWWPFKIKKIAFEQLCTTAKKMGVKAIDFLTPDQLPEVKKHGLQCAILQSHDLKQGMNNISYHAECLSKIRTSIDAAAVFGCPNVISFSGLREEISDEQGLANAVEGYKQIVGYAEKKSVTICVEYLNSKVNHPGYMFDNLEWGIELCDKVGSANLRILYDIYHAQVMEGDIIRTIREYHKYFGHYHTAGNPGRNEIDKTQEIYYPAIMREIVKTGYTGYVGHEFIPTREPLSSLAQAVKICDV